MMDEVLALTVAVIRRYLGWVEKGLIYLETQLDAETKSVAQGGVRVPPVIPAQPVGPDELLNALGVKVDPLRGQDKGEPGSP